MVSRTRLLLADDHLETAAQLRDLLQPEFDVIAHVTDGRALIRDAARLLPDVIVSDISMPESRRDHGGRRNPANATPRPGSFS